MSVSEAQDGVLRRVHSVGDLPRRPEWAYIHSPLRAAQSTSDPYDFNTHEAPRIRSLPPITQITLPTASSLPSLRLNTNADPSPPPLHTQTTIPGPQPQIALRVRILTFFGLGRNATRARKSLVSAIWNILWGFVQVRFRFISFYRSKLECIVRSNRPHTHPDCNPF